MYRYFQFSEFDSADQVGSGEKYMDRQFMEMIDYARGLTRLKFKIQLGYVSPFQAKRLGLSTVNSHRIGRAAEIFCINANKRHQIVTSLYEAGFTRIGINRKYIYVDNDDQKPDSLWLIT
jgi:hypothetical protein